MSYESALFRTRKAAAAVTGPHYRTSDIDVNAEILKPGDRIEIRANGQQAVVKEMDQYGWVLEGHRGWFPAKALKKLP